MYVSLNLISVREILVFSHMVFVQILCEKNTVQFERAIILYMWSTFYNRCICELANFYVLFSEFSRREIRKNFLLSKFTKVI